MSDLTRYVAIGETLAIFITVTDYLIFLYCSYLHIFGKIPKGIDVKYNKYVYQELQLF